MKKIICGGCSFSQDGIGGVPPGLVHDGGNSFLPAPDYKPAEPRSWSSFLAAELAVNSFVNVAASSHGNILTAMTIRYLLDNFPYSSSDTLVLFNITEPARFDQICDHDSHLKSQFIPWQENVIPFAFIDRRTDFLQSIEKQTGSACVERLTGMWLRCLCDYLKSSGFKFAFMTMKDYRDIAAYQWLYDEFPNRLIRLDSESNMIDFCVVQGMIISDQDQHPNLLGHQTIAKKVLEFLQRS
jgi:hypothetical protein